VNEDDVMSCMSWIITSGVEFGGSNEYDFPRVSGPLTSRQEKYYWESNSEEMNGESSTPEKSLRGHQQLVQCLHPETPVPM
jgi:hypothetical protein